MRGAFDGHYVRLISFGDIAVHFTRQNATARGAAVSPFSRNYRNFKAPIFQLKTLSKNLIQLAAGLDKCQPMKIYRHFTNIASLLFSLFLGPHTLRQVAFIFYGGVDVLYGVQKQLQGTVVRLALLLPWQFSIWRFFCMPFVYHALPRELFGLPSSFTNSRCQFRGRQDQVMGATCDVLTFLYIKTGKVK